MNSILQAALSYAASGLSVIPIRTDGSKAPALASWKEFQTTMAKGAMLRVWFGCDEGEDEPGIAVICGKVSGGLEVLDFDNPAFFHPWLERIDATCPGMIERLVVNNTPSGGYHVCYRCAHVEGNQKLARYIDSEGKTRIAIETRGEGGYFLVPPSSAQCHPLNKPYVTLGGSLLDLPTIAEDERGRLLYAARALNQIPEPEPHRGSGSAPTGSGRPGDDYNQRGDWHDLLTRHGWTRTATFGEASKWKRPGGDRHSATLNYAGRNLFTVFSSSCPPFEPDESYTLFQAYALLEHHGDFTAAARALKERGYGQERPSGNYELSRSHRPAETEIPPKAQRPSNTIIPPRAQRPMNTVIPPKPTRPTNTEIIQPGVRA